MLSPFNCLKTPARQVTHVKRLLQHRQRAPLSGGCLPSDLLHGAFKDALALKMTSANGQRHVPQALPGEGASEMSQDEPPPKVRAVAEEQENAATVPDELEAMDEATFTVVKYKKKRPAGIPVKFQPTQQGCSLWRLNPNLLAAAVVTSAQEKVLTHRMNKDGTLIVTVSTLAAANRLLEVTEIAGMAIRASVPRAYSANFGKILGVPLEYTDSELLEYLRDQGVISVRRQVSYVPDENGTVTESRRGSVILEFANDSPLPKRAYLGFCSYPIQEFMGAATQCFKCQRHGHIAKHCNGPVRCKVCAGSHSHKDCTSRSHPRCANCDGSHPASYGSCPKKKAATLARAIQQVQGTNPRRQDPPPNPEMVFTPTNALQADESTQTKTAAPNKSTNCPQTDMSSQIKTPPNKSYAMSVRENHKSLPPKYNQCKPTAHPEHASTSQTSRPRNTHLNKSSSFTTADLGQVLIPMLFAAIKAILRALPSSGSLPEVEAVLALEPLVNASYPTLQSSSGGTS